MELGQLAFLRGPRGTLSSLSASNFQGDLHGRVSSDTLALADHSHEALDGRVHQQVCTIHLQHLER